MERFRFLLSRRRASHALVALVAALALWTVAVPCASADHFMGDDSVDSGEIRYEDYTTYDGARTNAISVWNALGRIDILPDDASHICDLEIFDVDSDNFKWLGYWRNLPGADDIRMNTFRLNEVTPSAERSATIRHVMAHEFGHALGIGDHADSKWHGVALMYKWTCNACNDIQKPMAHDRTDYYSLWP